ncbi:hypothetical protein A3J20_04130 [Candidatus Gottesmanbacteria bacterium RIFCSPLOWO2_02_FULL_42_29]|uniref:Uncharacterized protein n=2 Tax=Candidatus Gottesmaniibacteriota TaxID=1752720 RepID=A0A1F6BH02_9BACT|nr:MAG: hypothetical protein UV09_C0004G0059 [Candidatus Gottesmanbacteria bacterium GW2011_GWA2_42_18]KKS74435.1 MAG: hypothetical protein UV46_C0043G0007 [Candidatus Gottesmanbacteria bacterium GW2011_GWC2_42_8]OGG09032.1 MAG: hypothetical protein A2781_06355 [Candidatus Gottesmanbacteria bacterium RIFCSPHIGHO2_01_FULL_42_27]OGG22162.1 MAG: hypothetical protein A3E72_03360 [Candidatus Gottesmanbacteria bacterium RIFCSPHIGHO2_12_FULL_43_26]OGG36084.1 MAG: hypothetical protein A3G68_01985 [Cand
MKKDVLSALVLGFLLGALAALVIVRLPSIIKRPDSSKLTVKNEKITPTVFAEKTSITIDKPKDLTIFGNSKIEISGKAQKAKVLTVESYKTSLILIPDESGNFKATIDLVEGGNPVIISGNDGIGNDETKTLNLFYTSEKI